MLAPPKPPALSKDAQEKYKRLAEELMRAPQSVKRARACLDCKLILSEDQFKKDGCPNCPGLNFRGNKSMVEKCTTRNYTGVISVHEPMDDGRQRQSWVARYHGLTGVAGAYALHVVGTIPKEARIKGDRMIVESDDEGGEGKFDFMDEGAGGNDTYGDTMDTMGDPMDTMGNDTPGSFAPPTGQLADASPAEDDDFLEGLGE